MPSFFQSLKRLVTGQPVFQDSDPSHGQVETKRPIVDDPSVPQINPNDSFAPAAPVEQPAPQERQRATPLDASGRKIMPVVQIDDIRCTEKGDNMECWAYIQNESEQPIELDKILLLGTKRELDRPLKPGEKRQFMVYSGPRPKDKYKNICEVHYFDKDRDYFSAIHDVQFDWHDEDKTYTIDELKLRLPIKDIYG